MSRGNYNGGSTVIGRSGWSTIDPAASDESDFIKYHSGKSKSEKAQNKRNKAKPRKSIPRLNLMHFILDRHLKGSDQFKLPKTMSQDLIDEIAKFGSPLKWAEKQGTFEKAKLKKLEKLQNSSRESSVNENKITKNSAVKLEKKIPRNKEKGDYEERVKRIEEKNIKAVRNVEFVRKQKPKNDIVQGIHKTLIEKLVHEEETLGDVSRNLKGYLLLWYNYQKYIKNKKLTKRRKHELDIRRAQLTNRIFQLLPRPPAPPILQSDVVDLVSFKKNIIESWKNGLDKNSLYYWNLLLPLEQQKYLFHKTGLSAFFKRMENSKRVEKGNLQKTKKAAKEKRNHRVKNVKKVERTNLGNTQKTTKEKRNHRTKTGVSNLGTTDALKVITKQIAEGRKDTWDYKKTDWDLT
jgi:hypothetical protein